jgi:hypothetical protein
MKFEEGRFYSKPDNKVYQDNYSKIFGEKVPWWEKRDKEEKKDEEKVELPTD